MSEITDIIVQDISGIPYFAGCFASEYCRTHMEHTLLSGFFAAINSFKNELSQEYLKIVGFDNLFLIVESEDPIMVILAAEDGYDKEKLRDLAIEILFNFKTVHKENSDIFDYQDPVINEEFSSWLHKRMDTKTSNLLPLLEKKKQGLLSRLKALVF